jgi:NADH-quinone oxidoreductase subunit H
MAQAFNYADDYKHLSNWPEIFKFKVLCGLWLVFIFGLTWVACWAVGVGVPWLILEVAPNTPPMVGEIFHAIVPILAILVFIPFNAMLMVLMERRGLALFTVRRGPCRVGPDGALQTAADAIKLLLKEDITPTGADAFMFTAAPVIFFAPSIFAAVPLLAAATNNNSFFQVVNLPTGIFYVLAAASVPVVGIVMGGWASNNKYSLVGGLRSAAQAISYEIPLVLSLISICVLSRSLDVVKIAQMQSGGLLHWNILGGGSLGVVIDAMRGDANAQQLLHGAIGYQGDTIALVAAVVLSLCTIIMAGMYLTSACAEINRIPFDLPEAESELVSGYNTEYSGIKFAIFFLAEFTNLFVVSTIFSVMFLGGGDFILPSSWFASWADAFNGVIRPLIDIHLINPDTFWAAIWLIVKVYLLVFFAILIRGTLPRFRIDQLMDFGWKRLIPITLAVFMVMVFLKVFVATPAGAPAVLPQ